MATRLERPELLAPAGDEESLRAAVAAGADAVYFGLRGGFNARARADNFAAAELPRLFDYLHAHGVRFSLQLIFIPRMRPEIANSCLREVGSL